ncbi:MAG: hypothetical protein P8Z35_06985 [Ignavibacteriaceae bacterium]
MKISTNNIGNYSINHIQKAAIQKTAQQKNINQTKTDLSADEKSFFIDRYPQKKDEIIDYHFYQKGGAMSGVKVGHLFDKKG